MSDKQSRTMKKKWKDPEYRKMMVEAHTGYEMPERQRKKIGDAHRGVDRGGKTQSECVICGEMITHFRSQPRKTCSEECLIELRSRQMKGNQYSVGFTPTPKQLANLQAGRRGKNSPSWKGGKSSLKKRIRESKKYEEWRVSVFERDSYTCQWCGAGGVYIVAHHIIKFSAILNDNDIQSIDEAYDCEDLWRVSNGQTLCNDCHKKTENYGNRET